MKIEVTQYMRIEQLLELSSKVFYWLSQSELGAVMLVCRRWPQVFHKIMPKAQGSAKKSISSRLVRDKGTIILHHLMMT